MFKKYDCVRLTGQDNNLEYAVIRARGFWIFRSYDIVAVDGAGHRIIMKRVRESRLEEV